MADKAVIRHANADQRHVQQLFGRRKKPARHNRSAPEPHCTAPGWLLFVICHETDEWCGWRGSNPRPLASEAQITIIEIASFHEGFKTL